MRFDLTTYQVALVGQYLCSFILMEDLKIHGKTEELRIYSFNATSIRGKLHEFNSHFDAQNFFDVISITESWLKPGVYDDEILFNFKYHIFRHDRKATTSKS